MNRVCRPVLDARAGPLARHGLRFLAPAVSVAVLAAVLAGCASHHRAPHASMEKSIRETRGAGEENGERASSAPLLTAEAGPTSGTPVDLVIARYGGVEVHASELGRWFFTTHRRESMVSLSKLIGVRVVEAEARRIGLVCPPEHLEEVRIAIVKDLNLEAAKAYGIGTTPERYLKLKFQEELEPHIERRLEDERQRWLFSRIIRYHAVLADRVELALIVVREESLARELAQKLDDGADFARLAQQHSVHESAKLGGILPPLPREALNPTVAEAAFSLPALVRSGVLLVDDGAGTRQFEIIRVLRRIPGRNLAYAEVSSEIERGLEEKGLDLFEWTAWYLRLERLYKVSISANL